MREVVQAENLLHFESKGEGWGLEDEEDTSSGQPRWLVDNSRGRFATEYELTSLEAKEELPKQPYLENSRKYRMTDEKSEPSTDLEVFSKTW